MGLKILECESWQESNLATNGGAGRKKNLYYFGHFFK